MRDAAGQIGSLLLGYLRPQTHAVKRNVLGGALIAVFLATTYVGLVMALWFAVDAVHGPAIASLAIAGASLVLGLLVCGITHFLNSRAERRRRELAQLRAAVSPEIQLAEAALGIMPELVRNKPFLTLAGVALAAFVTTRTMSGK